MEWLTQNWLWIVIAVGFFFLMSRGGGCGMGHSGGRHHDHPANSDDPQANRTIGSRSAFDPVNGHGIPANAPISSVYRDRIYHFENRENRDAFEGNPEKYLAESQVVGEPVGAPSVPEARSYRRQGGC